jgi:hypothetical protein
MVAILDSKALNHRPNHLHRQSGTIPAMAMINYRLTGRIAGYPSVKALPITPPTPRTRGTHRKTSAPSASTSATRSPPS